MKSLIGSLCIFWGLAFLVIICDMYISLIPLGIIVIGAILIIVDNYQHEKWRKENINPKNKKQ